MQCSETTDLLAHDEYLSPSPRHRDRRGPEVCSPGLRLSLQLRRPPRGFFPCVFSRTLLFPFHISQNGKPVATSVVMVSTLKVFDHENKTMGRDRTHD